MITVELKTRNTMLDVSSVKLGSGYRSGDQVLSRSSDSFWDDDDDYEE